MELRAREQRPETVNAMRKAQRELEAALRQTQGGSVIGLLFGAPSVERLARAVAMAHAAGVPTALISQAEAALEEAMRREGGKVSAQVSQLVETLDRLETAGTQAKLAHAGLAQAGLVADTLPPPSRAEPPSPLVAAASEGTGPSPRAAAKAEHATGGAGGRRAATTVIATPLAAVTPPKAAARMAMAASLAEEATRRATEGARRRHQDLKEVAYCKSQAEPASSPTLAPMIGGVLRGGAPPHASAGVATTTPAGAAVKARSPSKLLKSPPPQLKLSRLSGAAGGGSAAPHMADAASRAKAPASEPPPPSQRSAYRVAKSARG